MCAMRCLKKIMRVGSLVARASEFRDWSGNMQCYPPGPRCKAPHRRASLSANPSVVLLCGYLGKRHNTPHNVTPKQRCKTERGFVVQIAVHKY